MPVKYIGASGFAPPPAPYLVGGNFPHDPGFLLGPLGRGYVGVDAPTAQFKLGLGGTFPTWSYADVFSIQRVLRPALIASAAQPDAMKINRGRI